MIPLFKVRIPSSVDGPLLETIHSGFIGQGPKVDEFERELAPVVQNRRVLTTNSGTSAIHLALRLAGVGPGDEVISTPMTCTATNMPILERGARIVWADIDPRDGNIDPDSVYRQITPKTKAIVCVHWGGYPCLTFGSKVTVKKNNDIRLKNIGSLKEDIPDYILGIEGGIIGWTKVGGITEREYAGELIRINVGSREIRATPNHLFYTLEKGWLEAGKITAGLHVNICDIISYDEQDETLGSGAGGDFTEDLSFREQRSGDPKCPSGIHLEADQGESPEGKDSPKESCVDDEEISPLKRKWRHLLGIFGRDCRRGRNDIVISLPKRAYPDSNCCDLQHEQSARRFYYCKNRIFPAGNDENARGESSSMLFDNVEEFPRIATFRKNIPVLDSQESAGSISHELLWKTSGTGDWDEIERTRLFGNTPSPRIKWGVINSVSASQVCVPVYDLITESRNFYADGILVHNCDMDSINEIALPNDIAVIEDAAHAIGAVYKGARVGSISDFTCFSFQAIKHLTCVDGGALTCRTENDYRRGKLLRWYGIDRETPRADFRCEENIAEFGYKMHMNDISATIGIEGLKELTETIAAHRFNSYLYDAEIESRGLRHIRRLNYQDDRTSSYWLYTVLVDDRESFMRHMISKGIQVSRVHARNDKHSCFAGAGNQDGLSGVDEFDAHQCSIPVGWWIGQDEREAIMDAVAEWDRNVS